MQASEEPTVSAYPNMVQEFAQTYLHVSQDFLEQDPTVNGKFNGTASHDELRDHSSRQQESISILVRCKTVVIQR